MFDISKIVGAWPLARNPRMLVKGGTAELAELPQTDASYSKTFIVN